MGDEPKVLLLDEALQGTRREGERRTPALAAHVPGRDRHHFDLRHTRPGGGAGNRRRGGCREQRTHRPARVAAGRLRPASFPVRGRVPRQREPARRRAGRKRGRRPGLRSSTRSRYFTGTGLRAFAGGAGSARFLRGQLRAGEPREVADPRAFRGRNPARKAGTARPGGRSASIGRVPACAPLREGRRIPDPRSRVGERGI